MIQPNREREHKGLSYLVREALTENPEAVGVYLRRGWLNAAIRALREARRRAGLTQAEVAERIGTTQPAIARLENDRDGRFTLHRFVDYALACGMAPLDIVLEPVETLREYVVAEPDAPRTQLNYDHWAHALGTANLITASAVHTPFAGISADRMSPWNKASTNSWFPPGETSGQNLIVEASAARIGASGSTLGASEANWAAGLVPGTCPVANPALAA